MPYDEKSIIGSWFASKDRAKQEMQTRSEEDSYQPTPPATGGDSSVSGSNQSFGSDWQGINPLSLNNQAFIYNHTLGPIQDFFNRAAGSMTNSMTMDITKRPLEENPSLPSSIKQDLAPPQTTSEKAANILGDLAGFIVPGEAAYKTGGTLALKGLEKLAPKAPKIAQNLVRGAGAGVSYGAADQALDAGFDTHGDGSQSIGQRLGNIGLDAAMFGGGDALFGLAGQGIKKIYDAYKAGKVTPDVLDQALKQRVGDLTQPSLPEQPVNVFAQNPFPTVDGQLNPLLKPDISGFEYKPNPYRQELDQAVKDQVAILKNDLQNLDGVEQGKVFRDEHGDVVGRQGRQSNNPQWYQDFFAINGRKPNISELDSIARDQLLNGYRTEMGDVPSWKPKAAQDLHNEIQDIHSILANEKDQAIKSSFESTLAELQKAHDDIISQLKPKENPWNGLEDVNHSNEGVKGFFGNIANKIGKGSQDTIARNQVVNNLRKNLGLTIDTGRMSLSKAQGEYKVQPEVIRTKRAEDINVIAHEIGHHLEKRLNLVDPAYEAELRTLAHPLTNNNPAYGPNDILEEGLAEFFRRYLTEDHAQLKQQAPNLFDYITNKVKGKKIEVKGKKYDIAKGLDKTREDMQTWINQGEINQAIGMIDFKSGSPKEVKATFGKWYTAFVDDLNPLKLFEKSLKGKIGLGSDSIYKMARTSRGTAEMARVAVEKGVYLNGQKVNEGLAEIGKDFEKVEINGKPVDPKEFAAYLVAKHADDLKGLGKATTFDQPHIDALKAKFDGTPIEDLQKRVVKFNNALMDVMVDAQIISPKAAKEMRAKYPNYVPFLRYFDDDAVAGFKNGGYGASSGFANLTNPVKRMSEFGSERTIINPFESMVKNTFLAFNAATKNKVGLQLAEMSKIDGAGAWVEHLGEGGRDSKEHIVTVFENGKPTQYKLRDPDLYNAMLSLDHESSVFIIRFLGSFASSLRAGAVLTPEFMGRNVMRDNLDAFINTGLNPLNTIKGLLHAMRKDDVFQQFITSGAAQSTLMSLDRDFSREALKKVFRESMADKTMNVITDPKEFLKFFSGYSSIVKPVVGTLRKGAEISEQATRIGRFSQTLKKTGDLNEAAFQARDLIDFNRAGSNVRQANRIVAFINAQIQGTDKMLRSFKENKASYLTRATIALVLPAYMCYRSAQNLPPDLKKIYDNIPQWQKDTFFVFNIPGTDQFARVPKPFEAGMIFSTGTEKALEWLNGQDPKAKEYGTELAFTFIPNNWIPSMMLPIIEGLANYSFFQKRNIIPQSEQRLEKVDQYSPTTSETAKLIGKGLANTPLGDTNFGSPRIIDNTIRGYTAGLGSYAVSGLDAALKGLGVAKNVPQPEKYWYEQKPVSGFMATTTGGGQLRDDFYNKLDEVTKQYNSNKKNGIMQVNPEYKKMNLIKNAVDKLNRVYKQIQSAPNMDSHQKRVTLDNIQGKLSQLYDVGLKR